MEKKLNKTTAQAIKAQAAGVTHVIGVICQHFATSYYNVHSINHVISRERWVGVNKMKGSRCGLTAKDISERYPDATIITYTDLMTGSF